MKRWNWSFTTRFLAFTLAMALTVPFFVMPSDTAYAVTPEEMQAQMGADAGNAADGRADESSGASSSEGGPVSAVPERKAAALPERAAAVLTDSRSLGTGTGTQRETKLHAQKYLENDKYLSDPTGERNGQNTYDLYLEQAVVDENHPTPYAQNPAPKGQNVLFILDRSSSMAHDSLVAKMNDATAAMVQRMKDFNDLRMAEARAGVYSDIDPNGNVEAQMKDHLINAVGVIGYNSQVYETWHVKDGVPVTTDAAVSQVSEKLRLVNNDTFFQMETRTDLATAKALEWVRQETDPSKAYVVLLTDGVPTRLRTNQGWDHNFYYLDGQYIGSFSMENTNSCLADIRKVKDLGAGVECFYIKAGSANYSETAEKTGRIEDIDPYSTRGIAAIFLSLYSSDYPKNGQMTYTGNSPANYRWTGFTYDPDDRNRCGKHYVIMPGWDSIYEHLTELPVRMNAVSDVKSTTGYAGADSVVMDTLTMPFHVSAQNQIQVYKVPRIPANLDARGVPTDRDASGNVSAFRWGEQVTTDASGNTVMEWEDITDEVSVKLTDRTVSVSGFDYEANALTVYDKDTTNRWHGSNADAISYKAGDYGYKLVVLIPMYAEYSFGGNGIATNQDSGTQFVPGTPHPDTGLPAWKNNSGLNPQGKSEIVRYPVPKVDLKVSYDVVCDSLKIYAPQTAGLLNLVTDRMGSIWYQDDAYPGLKTAYDNACTAVTNAEETLKEKQEEYGGSPTSAQTADLKNLEKQILLKQDAMLKAERALSQASCYAPNGINNQFVNIHYELRSPSGAVVGTMDVPHGKAYDGSNLAWSFTQSRITESGAYTVNAVITPVDTQASPSGLVYTCTDDDVTKRAAGYPAEQYSSTGSTASGSQSARTFSKKPAAHIFQLRITAADTRLVPRQTLDFFQGNEDLSKTDNVHILKYEWVCTDGKTVSQKEDEPGFTGDLAVGLGAPVITNTVPERAFTDGLVVNLSGTDACGDRDGIYVPVAVNVRRAVGALDKWLDTSVRTQQTNVIMTDSDNLYGPGKSSVVWVHRCDVTDGCASKEFADAQKYGGSENASSFGKIRYLIHVEQNPKPKIDKSTSTPVISRGEDIKWQILLENNDAEENPNHRMSDFSLVDVLPYPNDQRLDPLTGNTYPNGSTFHGELWFKSATIDLSGSAASRAKFADGSAKVYYTVDKAVRTASEYDLLSGRIAWKEAKVSVNGNTATVSGLDRNAQAVKIVTRLAWDESLKVNLSANLKDPGVQAAGDRYHNQAGVYNGNGGRLSEVVATEVNLLYLSGILWNDEDGNGIATADEPRISGATVTLYKAYNPDNGGAPDRVIDGVRLSRVFNSTDREMISPVSTDSSGAYSFTDLQQDTYYVVADYIDGDYTITRKNAGTDASSRLLDSKCETSFVSSTGNASERTAWIKGVPVGKTSVQGQNFGFRLITGGVKVYKSLDEIYYPMGMTDEEKADYQLVFTFKMRHTGTGQVLTKTVRLKPEDFSVDAEGNPQCFCEFSDLKPGVWELYEERAAQYGVTGVTAEPGSNTSWNAGSGKVTLNVTNTVSEFTVHMKNSLKADPPGGDENGMKNLVKVRVPVKLEVKYVGQNPVSSNVATKYTFNRQDFDPARRGDIVVTYDDGTQISLSKGTLGFGDITVEPGAVTNLMNSKEKAVLVTCYYSEKGRVVRDSFYVKVNLKPAYRFVLTFDANGSSFTNGAMKNTVHFAYDDNQGCNVVTGGSYMDTANGKLRQYGNGFTFAGWNTQPNGSGVNYTGFEALNAIGRAKSDTNVMTLYANWKCSVTFHANGGTLTGGSTDAERAVAGNGSGNVPYSLGQSMATGLQAQKDNAHFVLWNTSPDGRGTSLTDYGRVYGPVTFYAVYYQSEYPYTGGPQVFTAPVSGTYAVELWGGCGNSDEDALPASYGGYSRGNIHLSAGQQVYVVVGGGAGWSGSLAGAYNGGGVPVGPKTYGAGGGGATHIASGSGQELYRYGSAAVARNFVYLVAGGSGGLSDRSGNGNSGGGESGGMTSTNAEGKSNKGGGLPGTQDSGYAFGMGEPASGQKAAGGGGWYGGFRSKGWYTGAGGGSGFVNPAMVAGGSMRNDVKGPGDHNGYARILLVSRD